MIDEQRSWWFYVARFGIALLISAVLYAILAVPVGGAGERKVVTVYAFSDMLSSEVFEPFTKKTGIEVVVKHFETVEEVVSKLIFTGDHNIDIIAPTDSMVEVFRREELLQKVQPHLLSHYRQIDQRLMSRYYDPYDEYSVPFSWAPLGIGYDTRVITMPHEQIGWDLVLGSMTPDGVRPPYDRYGKIGHVCLGEDPWEAIFIVAIALFGSSKEITPEKYDAIVSVLRAQKEWLECYTNNLKYFLISGVSSAVVMPSPYLVNMQRNYPWADFVVPQEGSLVFIGDLVIPEQCAHVEEAHQVIDYLISVEGGLACFEEHAYNPSNRYAYEHLPERVKNHPYLLPNDALMRKLEVFHNEIPLQDVEKLWHRIKL